MKPEQANSDLILAGCDGGGCGGDIRLILVWETINDFAAVFNLQKCCLHLFANFHAAGVNWSSLLNTAYIPLEVPTDGRGIHAHLYYKPPKIFRAGAARASEKEISPVE
jgi:hypothetical protein